MTDETSLAQIVTAFIAITVVFAGAFVNLFLRSYNGRHVLLRPFVAIIFSALLSMVTLLSGPEWLLLVLINGVCSAVLIALIAARSVYRNLQLNRTVITPEFRLTGEARFYQLGALMDGHLTNKDLAAHFIYRRLHPDSALDETENRLEQLYVQAGGFNRYLETLSRSVHSVRTSPNRHIQTFIYTDYSGAAAGIVSESLVQGGYYRFNPVTVRDAVLKTAFFILLTGAVLSAMIQQFTVISFLAFATAIPLFQAGSAVHLFAENVTKSVPLIRRARGHKMYLKTAERFRITSDKDVFRELVPYFIVYNIREDLAREGLEAFGLISETEYTQQTLPES
ncbi:MAG: hypothetical protein TR69_WS6001000037 [candidate division WS6 bacterium OLB20]|uniref:Uncharacterized protein n=1 Tax=candidate division WS6 bacterium OLB20 TaxID=1617426 RepID=A0A136M123_9BACT|nr:MAG: hypothetical protein TR69_WS6001000037 [candidate division WS6 bacterium OLB20]